VLGRDRRRTASKPRNCFAVDVVGAAGRFVQQTRQKRQRLGETQPNSLQ
jgi:hypothetical protein